MEHRFTIPRIAAAVAETGLEFLGFDQLSPALADAYRRDFPGDPTMADLDSWARFEAAHPRAFSGYVFWLRRRA